MKFTVVCLLFFAVLCSSQMSVKKQFLAERAQCHENSTKSVPDDVEMHVFLVPHTHNDPGWLVTSDQYYVKQVKFILNTVIAALQTNKKRKFTYVEQAFFQRWWNEQNDKMKQTVRDLVHEGRLELNLGGWVMTDEAGAYYEDIINEMTLGHKYIFDQFGVRPTVAWHVDPFGHSNQVMSLYADMGFDTFTLDRIHYDDDKYRKEHQKMEFIERGSKSLDKESDIFVHVLDSGYAAPAECNFYATDAGQTYYWTPDDQWAQWDDDLPTYKNNMEYHAERFAQMVRKRAAWYDNGNNLILTYGEDFTFHNAFIPFENMDKFMDYINDHYDKYHIRFQYAVLSDYIKAVHEHDKKWDIKRDDFFPYANKPSGFWTGYFTSRDRLKGLIREKTNELSNAEMYLALSKATKKNLKFDELYKDILKLRKAQGEAQHHDAITGTEKQAVANDYNVQLVDGAFFTNKAVSEMLNVYTTLDNLNKNATEVFSQLTKENAVVLLLSNPVGWSRKETIQVLLPRSDISVYDKNDNEIESQIIEVPEFSYDHRNGTHYLYFVHEIPAMGYSSVYLKINENREVSKVVNSNFIENDRVKLTLENGYVAYATLSDGSFYRLDANLYHYKSAHDLPQSSGAYAFIPAQHGMESIGSTGSVTVTSKYTVYDAPECDHLGYLITERSLGSYNDVMIGNIASSSKDELNIITHRLDGEGDKGWGQTLTMNYYAMDLDHYPEYTDRGYVAVPSDSPLSFQYTFQFKHKLYPNGQIHVFTSPVHDGEGYMTVTLVKYDAESATVLLQLTKGSSWSKNSGFYYLAFNQITHPFTEYDSYTAGAAIGKTKDGFEKKTFESSRFFPNTRIFVQVEASVPAGAIINNVTMKTFEIGVITPLTKESVDYSVHYLVLPTEAIGEYVVPQNKPISTTVIKGNLVEEIQQTYRTGYHTIFRLYKQGIQSNVIELNTELNNVDEGRELVLQFHTSLKNDKTVYADTIGMEQQKRVFNPDFTQPIAGNFYPVVSRAYIEDEKEDMRLSVLVDRAHGVSSLRDGYMEIMLKRRTIGDDGYGVGEPLTENDQVKEKMWLILGNREESSIYKKYDVLMNHYPVQFYGIENEKKEIHDVYSSLLSELPPQIQLLNFQLLTPEDKTFLLRLHHIYEKDESKENSIEVEVDLNKIFREFEIVDYEEMILTGMFKKSEVEEERMKWKTVEDDNVMESNETVNVLNRNIRGSKSFIIRMKPMEFKTFQVTIN